MHAPTVANCSSAKASRGTRPPVDQPRTVRMKLRSIIAISNVGCALVCGLTDDHYTDTSGNHFYKALSLICHYQWLLLSATNPMGLSNWAVPMGYQTPWLSILWDVPYHPMGNPFPTFGPSHFQSQSQGIWGPFLLII